MRFVPTKLAGAFVIEIDPHADERGFFARTWCHTEAAVHGIRAEWVQCNVSFNKRAGTLRGLHYQTEPSPEAKLIRCTQGAAFDVLVDLRRGSPTYGEWMGAEISAANHRMIYAPAGCAHGFQTLVDETELFYQMSEFFNAELTRGVRWDDPTLAIQWPACAERIISERDLRLPYFG